MRVAMRPARLSLWQLALQFLKMGSVGYGGPIALVALMEKECASRLKWISPRQFNEAYVYCKLLPGPVAYQMALFLGQHVRGKIGGLVAGAAFLLPAFCLILGLSYSYSYLQKVTGVQAFLEGFRVGALVVMLDSAWRLLRPVATDVRSWAFIVAAGALMFVIPRYEPLTIVAAGLAMVLAEKFRAKKAAFAWPILLQLFWTHFKAGAFVFGTGVAIVPVLEREVVQHAGWLTAPEFLDGLAFGQITPGPITISSVFIGYRVAELPGALAAFSGMYLPGLILVLGVLPLALERLEGRKWLRAFQSGAIPAVVGCILGATLSLGHETLSSVRLALIFVVLLTATILTRVPAWLLIPVGGVIAAVGARL